MWLVSARARWAARALARRPSAAGVLGLLLTRKSVERTRRTAFATFDVGVKAGLLIPKTHVPERTKYAIPTQRSRPISFSASSIVEESRCTRVDRCCVYDAVFEFKLHDNASERWIIVALNNASHPRVVNLYPRNGRFQYAEFSVGVFDEVSQCL